MLKTSAEIISDMLDTVTLREVVARDWPIDRLPWRRVSEPGLWRKAASSTVEAGVLKPPKEETAFRKERWRRARSMGFEDADCWRGA